MASNTSSNVLPYTIGVLVLPPVQLLDISSIDLFGMCQKSYMDVCPLPQPLKDLGHPNLQILYITPKPNELSPCTADLPIKCTHDLTSPEVAPGKLDVLMIPGPEPNYEPSDAEKIFIQGHAKTKEAKDRGTVVMTVCTGIFPAAYAGILDGEVATAPRGLLGDVKKKFPKVKWIEKRWATSESGWLWMSAGVTNGHDMVAAYLHSAHAQEHGVSTQLADLVQRMADVGDRGQDYATSGTGEGVWWVWLIIRSIWKGKSK